MITGFIHLVCGHRIAVLDGNEKGELNPTVWSHFIRCNGAYEAFRARMNMFDHVELIKEEDD